MVPIQRLSVVYVFKSATVSWTMVQVLAVPFWIAVFLSLFDMEWGGESWKMHTGSESMFSAVRAAAVSYLNLPRSTVRGVGRVRDREFSNSVKVTVT